LEGGGALVARFPLLILLVLGTDHRPQAVDHLAGLGESAVELLKSTARVFSPLGPVPRFADLLVAVAVVIAWHAWFSF
jgi:hypothetical protein